MPTLTMMCGLPRSGKTTWATLNSSGKLIVSADQLRYLVYGQRFWGPGEPLTWAIRDIVLKTALEQGLDVIIDETNTKPERRKPIIDLAKKYGYTVHAVVMTTPADTCKERAEAEGGTAIIPIIEKMRDQWVEPEAEEGYDGIMHRAGYVPLDVDGIPMDKPNPRIQQTLTANPMARRNPRKA